MKVADVMTPDPVTIESVSSLDRALELMDRLDIRHLPVMEDGRLAGILSDRDVLEATGWLLHGQGDPDGQVRAHMRMPVESVKPDVDVNQAAVVMSRGRIGCAPVVAGADLVGIVTEIDLLRAFSRGCRKGLFGADQDPPVRTIMTSDVVSADLTTTLEETREMFRANQIRHVPIRRGDEIVAMVSDRDLRRAIGRRIPDSTRVSDVVQGGVISVPVSTRLSEAAEVMAANRISALTVQQDEKTVGILTTWDVLDHVAKMPWRAAGSAGA
jgi:acetoin utilization protein AcuB